ncbi:Calmodulin-binding protein 60 E [Hibiscus syriacus]|uniref:Calmodulin-binding protein 60 E n=1 Tax=Hibiscus syriacus TaxID=106335 RepID=A0A6A3AXK0_HIBSY|nr:Calmodulin-binding protein 60 E [Hibiscus syriacus]
MKGRLIGNDLLLPALKVDSLQKLCSSLEPILRRVVSEEVERAIAKLGSAKLSANCQCRFSPKWTEGPNGRNLQLHFKSRLSLPLYTGGKVEGEQGAAIHAALVDANTGHVITCGPESVVKLDVVVIEGDFNNEDDDNWTEEEFDSHIVKEHEGKRPLLTGELQIMLEDGIRIREAKTEAFTVKDHRGESEYLTSVIKDSILYKKHYPHALNDEVWRLEKIDKDGSFHKRMNKAGIFTIEDFLRLVIRDLQRLRNILGSGMSNKMWDVLVEHARTCDLSGKLYVYYPDDVRSVGIVFNNIYKLNPKEEDSAGPSQASSQTDPQGYPISINQQETLPALTVSVPSEHPPMDSSLNIGGDKFFTERECYDDNMAARLSMQSQNEHLHAQTQYNDASFNLHNPMVGSAHHVQVPGNDNEQSLGPSQSSIPGFRDGGTLSIPTYKAIDDFLTEDEIRIRSNEMLDNEDMQHLLCILNMGSHNCDTTTPFNATEDVNPCSSEYMPTPSLTYDFDNKAFRSSGKAVVGWLKLKAALRWGIFIRKKAAERRAHLVELDDP